MNAGRVMPVYPSPPRPPWELLGNSPIVGLHQNLSEGEAADFLGISISSLRKSRMNGPRANYLPPPPYVKLGRRVIYRVADLAAFLESNLASMPSGAAK